MYSVKSCTFRKENFWFDKRALDGSGGVLLNYNPLLFTSLRFECGNDYQMLLTEIPRCPHPSIGIVWHKGRHSKLG